MKRKSKDNSTIEKEENNSSSENSVQDIVKENATHERESENSEDRAVVFEEAIEAILFAAGHPVTYSTLARVFEMTPSKVKDKVFEYSLKYNDPSFPRGVILLTFKDSCQLCTKQYYLPEIRNALGIKKSGSLSTSSMETLAIIAYNQPVTRIFVDTLRRVDSSYAMNNLLDRGLIESKGRMDAPGRPMLYGTTLDFLRCFGLKDLESLPKTTDEMMAVFSNAKLSEEQNEENSENTEIDEINDNQMEIDINNIDNNKLQQDSSNSEFEEEESADDFINIDDN